MKKTALISYKGQTIFVAPVVDLELRDYVKKQKEAENRLAGIVEFADRHEKELEALKQEVEALKREIKVLKGEDDELGID